MTETFTYNDMKSALPVGESNASGPPDSVVSLDGWAAQDKEGAVVTAQIVDTQPSAASARVYEWNEEYGDVGPCIPELERELFGDPENRGEGVDFSK